MENIINISDCSQQIGQAEEILSYEFKDKTLLLRALTHPSAVRGSSNLYSYERLEFLGDSLLSAIVSERAYKKYSKMDEGKLSHVRIALVSGNNLSKIAKKIGLEDLIILGKSEKCTGNRGMQSALENVFEAIIAALYLDGGLKITCDFVEKYVLSQMTEDGKLASEENPKSILQEKLQSRQQFPVYYIKEEYGPAHDKTFVAQVSTEDKVLAQGSGKTKKEAEVNAASSALDNID